MKLISALCLCLFLVGCASTGHVRYVDVTKSQHSKSDPPDYKQLVELRDLLLDVKHEFDGDLFGPGRTVLIHWEEKVRRDGQILVAADRTPLGRSITIFPANTKFLLYLPTNMIYADHGSHQDPVSRWDVANLIEIVNVATGKNPPNDLLLGWFKKWENHNQRVEALKRATESYRVRPW